MSTEISLVRCAAYDPAAVQQALAHALKLLGGLGSFVSSGARVLVKPNLLLAAVPEQAIVTHPEVVRALIRQLKQHGCTVLVGDSPSVWEGESLAVAQVYEVSGIAKVCAQEQVPLVTFDKRRWRGKFPLAAILDEVDAVVNVPKFKTHSLTTLTGGIKNLFGLVSGTFKTELHKNYFDAEEFNGILTDIYAQVRPALTVIDGITAMQGDGPATSGVPRQLGLLLAGRDCVALDTAMATIMGIAPTHVRMVRIAYERGLGEARLEHITVKGEPLAACVPGDFVLPSTALSQRVPAWFVRYAKRFFRHLPKVVRGRCVRCGICIKVCPYAAIHMGRSQVLFDYNRCISCFCCLENCPHGALRVHKSFFARLMKI